MAESGKEQYVCLEPVQIKLHPQKYPDLQTIRSIDELTAEIPDPETIPSAENTEALIQAAEKTKNLCRETAEIITKIIQIFDRLGGI